jgi:hypothetical protein
MGEATHVNMDDDGEAMLQARRMVEQPSPLAGTPRDPKDTPAKAPTPPATEINMNERRYVAQEAR